jgi:beta-N-acetylhexosaminidase
MSVAALARSIIAVGFEGATSGTAPLAELRAFGPGAVMLFGRNTGPAAALRELVADLRAIDDLPPLIAVDQEGGRVARIGDPVAQLPAAMAISAAGDTGACEQLGLLLGRDLARIGISVDFAPVADCALEAANTVIGARAFGDDPLAVGRFAGAFARGLERGGVARARSGAVCGSDLGRRGTTRDGRARRRRGARCAAAGFALAARSYHAVAG